MSSHRSPLPVLHLVVDHVRVLANAGNGGDGAVSFRREKFVPRGGPDGGDGGRGGSIIFRVDENVDNLTEFYYTPILKAKNGERGRGKQCYGKAAPDQFYHVPVGTVVYRLPEKETAADFAVAAGDGRSFIDLSELPASDEAPPPPAPTEIDPANLLLVADLKEAGVDYVLCKGGAGGKGNIHFKSGRNRAPTQYTEGEEGEGGTFYLELRKIADAGLVGYPNAGKSTLLTRISQAHPKIAPYPFTTLTPQIGVVELPGYQRVTVADIPGLVEGAHANVGLGHDFLRHIVRCKLLVFVIDIAGSEGREPIADLQTLRRELDLYDAQLSSRSWLVAANKMDLPGAGANLEIFRARYPKIEVVPISAEHGTGIEELKLALARHLPSSPPPAKGTVDDAASPSIAPSPIQQV